MTLTRATEFRRAQPLDEGSREVARLLRRDLDRVSLDRHGFERDPALGIEPQENVIVYLPGILLGRIGLGSAPEWRLKAISWRPIEGAETAPGRVAPMRAAATIVIACAREHVFDSLADMRNETQWNSGVSVAELRGDEPVAQGSRFHVVNNGTPYDVTLQAYERPSLLVFEATGKPDVTITYRLTPSSAGSELAGELVFRPKGAFVVLFAVLAPVIRRNVRKQFASLKSLCER
jgi:uncharacterized protein YndB with AHSA1/START domain